MNFQKLIEKLSNDFFSHFGFYDEDENVIPLFQRNIYKNDDIGLRTLCKEGRLKILTFPGVQHFAWHLNVSVIQQAIVPYLD